MQKSAFDNFVLGPVIALTEKDSKEEIEQDILNKGLVSIAYITDANNPVFKQFSDLTEDKPVAAFVTIAYYKNYE